MKKEEIYVVIDDEPKRLRAIQILTDVGETILDTSSLLDKYQIEMELKFNIDFWWVTNEYNTKKTEITIDQLEELLNPNFVVKEVVLSIDELKTQAESLGFELVKKERKIKVGDFGKFYIDDKNRCAYGFVTSIVNNKFQIDTSMGLYKNFAHLTDEEKKQIQENW